MNKFFYKKKKYDNIIIYKSKSFKDKRGEIWSLNLKDKNHFKLDKFTFGKKNSLRGFHGDNKTWKLVTCILGKCYCIIVNYDCNSKFFLKKYYFTLSQKNKISILIPPKMLLGWLALSKKNIFYYKMKFNGQYNDVKNQISIKWDSKAIKAKWPVKKPILSVRDTS